MRMLSRRAFLRTGSTGAAALAAFTNESLSRAAAAADAAFGRSAADLAGDENYWHEIQQAFTLDRTLINLNNGGCSPSPRVVHEAFKRYLDLSNEAPVYHMWQILEPNIETVRRRLAAEFGCDPEEMAITRNASEALQIAQLGIDLAPATRSSPRIRTTAGCWTPGISAHAATASSSREISFPVPPPSMDDLADRLLSARSRRATKVLHFCHITNLTGQIFPVRKICDAARAQGHQDHRRRCPRVRTFPVHGADLGCDYYGTSLHKWLLAPIGTGFLYVRARTIEALWPLTPANATRAKDIRKFEEIGTHPAANHNAIAEALTFHDAIGSDRKAARLRYLRNRWADRLRPERPVQDSHEHGSGAVVRHRHRADRRRPDRQGRTRSSGTSGGSSPHRSCTPSTKACASRPTSTRRSKRSTPSPDAMMKIS